ncbi:MAG TPA: metal-dependent hydrolase [Gemmatimonadales bacterium]
MDNLCHTLAGAVLAEAGLRRRTPLAVPTALIGANAPDLDALALLRDPLFALSVRRGWTHGLLAMLVLPTLLAALMLGWDRLLRRRRDDRADPMGLLTVAAAAVLSHPLLDLLNTYGVRLLMPFSGRWFHGDALFIVDPWLWLLFGMGTGLAIRRRRRGADPEESARPARAALVIACGYIGLMLLSNVVGREIVRSEAARAGVAPVGELMLAPAPVNPLRRSVVLVTRGGYRRGTFRWLTSPHLTLDSALVPSGLDGATAKAAAASPEGAAFLRWSRFPATVIPPGEPSVVRLYDLRYAGPAGGWASVDVGVGSAPGGP